MENYGNNKILNFISKKRNVIIFFLASILLLISTLIFTNFETISEGVNKVIRDIKLALVNVDGIEISQVLIDQDRGQYNSTYTWNATDRNERRTFTLQINYKKTNNIAYEPGDLVIEVPNIFTKQSSINGAGSSSSGTAFSSNPCNIKDKESTWNYSSDPTKCKTSTYSSGYDKIYFTNNQKIEANSNFEGTIRIKFYEIDPYYLLNGLNNTFHSTLNGKVNTNNLTFKFTSNKKSFSPYLNTYKIEGYDGLPSNASNYIWIKVNPNYSSNDGVRGLVYSRYYPYDTQPAETGLSYKAYKYSKRYRLSLPSNAIFYSWNNAYTYETDGGYGYYRYNNGYNYYNGKNIGSMNDYFYIGLPKSQYTDKSVSFTVYYYGIYSHWYDYIDESKSHNYEYLGSATATVNTSNYLYETPSTDKLYSLKYNNFYHSLDPSNLKSGVNYDSGVNIIYTGTNFDFKIGSDVLYKKNSSNSISKLSDSQYYFHVIYFNYNSIYDANGNPLKPVYDVDLYVRYKNSSSYVKYGDTFVIGKSQSFEFPDNNVVGFYFKIYNLDTSFSCSSIFEYNVVFTNSSISQGDTLYHSPYMEVYRHNYSSPIYTPSSSSYTGDIASQLRSYDSSTYGHYTIRNVESTNAIKTYDYFSFWGGSSSTSGSVYKRSVYKATISESADMFSNYSSSDNVARGFLKQNKGYEMYVYLPEGFYVDPNDVATLRCYPDSDALGKGYIKKNNGTLFSSKEEYCDYVQEHATIKVTKNWKNKKRTLIKVRFDYTDAPLDYTDYLYYLTPYKILHNSVYSAPEYYAFNIYYDKENIAQYNKNQFTVEKYLKTIGGPTSAPSSGLQYLEKDTLDINEDGSTNDLVSKYNYNINVYFTEESNQDAMTFIKSDDDEYNGDHTLVSYSENYSYKLRVRNTESKITNLVIYDSIENYIKKNGQFEKAAGEITNLFSGTFQGVDTSYAQSQGYKVKVYYSESETPGSLGSDSSWKTYTEGTTDKSLVKTLAFEYYNSSGSTKATLPKDTLTYVEIKMKSPASITQNKTVAYNGCWVEWNALDTSNNVIPNIVGVNSNVASVAISTVLKVKHYYKDTTTEIAPEETYDIYGGSDYETKASTKIPSGWTFDHTEGDPAEGVITKSLTEVIYYYRELEPNVTASIKKQGYDSIDTRGHVIDYKITYTSLIKDIKGTANLKVVDQLPFEIDTSKPYDLKGGVYDAENKTITWEDSFRLTAYDQDSDVFVFNISFYYLNIPVTTRNITNTVTATTTLGTYIDEQVTTTNTAITEQFKLTVHHYYYGTTEKIAPDVITYKDGGAVYVTNPADVSLNYEIIIPENDSGTIQTEETEVIYYYKKRDPIYTTSLEKTGNNELAKRNNQLSYQIKYLVNIKDYVGTSDLVIVDQLPFEIDTTKEYNLDGGTYDAVSKTITWNKEIVTTKLEETSHMFIFNIDFTYKEIPISVRSLSNIVNATLNIDNKTDSKEVTKETAITERFKVLVHHYYLGTTDSISPDVITYYPGGEDYFTHPADVSLNYEITTPINANGTILSEETEVIYYYRKRNLVLSTSIDNTGTSTIDKRSDQVNYKISYNATIKDYVGVSDLVIVDNLPYEIDTTKEYNLDGGIYNANNKTITWNKKITTTVLEESNNLFEFNINFSYLNIPVVVRNITNSVTSTLEIDDSTDTKQKTKTTNITEQFKLTTHHYYNGTTDSISPDVVVYKDGGVAYNTSPATVPADYDVITPSNSSGSIENEETVVTYYYERRDPNLSGSVTITGTDAITSFEDLLEYTISYSTEIGDYVGPVTLRFVDTLPYEIDTTKEYNLNGGIYDPDTKTITWNKIINKTNVENETISDSYNISFVFKDVNRRDRTLINKIDGKVILENKNIEKNVSFATNNEVIGKIIVKYIDIDSEEEKELEEQVEVEDIIYTNKYVPVARDIDTYKLVESPENEEYDFEEDDKILYFKYKKIKHNIITRVIGNNGTMQGDEIVDEGSDSTKDFIVIRARDGYEISALTINGEQISLSRGLNKYTLANFKDVREDKLIVAEFTKKLENPPTGSFSNIAIIFIFVFGGALLYLFAQNYAKFKKI